GGLLDGATGKAIRGEVSFLAAPDNPSVKKSIAFGGTGPVPAHGYARGDGRFALPVLPGPGWLCVTARDETGYVRATTQDPQGMINAVPHPISPSFHHAVIKVNAVEGKPASLTLDVRLEPARSRAGKAVGPDGKEVTGCLVAGLNGLGRIRGQIRGMQPLRGAEFTVGGLSTKQTRLVALLHPRRGLGKVLPVRGDQTGPFTVRLEPLASVSGRVVGPDGKPQAGVRVHVRPTSRL